MPNEKVNWGSLTKLHMLCSKLTDVAIQHILSGTPSLESFKLEDNLLEFDKLVIASKSLKILVLDVVCFNRIEISCPDLEKLSLRTIVVLDGPDLFAQAIENVLSDSLLLESFQLQIGCCYSGEISKLVIASKSLKILALSDLVGVALEISCPNLEQLTLFNRLTFKTAKLLNLSSSLSATIDSYHTGEECMIKDILRSLQHVQQLKIGTSFIKDLSKLDLKGGLALPLLNIKCLILNSFDLNLYPYGVASLLHNSLVLEKLVIKTRYYYDEGYDYQGKLSYFMENYWNSNKIVFKCLVSHLKTIEIIGFPHKDHNSKLMLNFVQFIFKNARVLEKMVVRLKDETTFMLKVSEELSCLPRYSRHAIIECCSA